MASAAAELASYATMLRLRRFEEKAGLLYALGTLGTPCPLGVGQEAALTAVAGQLSPGDELLAVPGTPALEIALGVAPVDVLRRLVPTLPDGGAVPECFAWTRSRRLIRSPDLAAAACALEGTDEPATGSCVVLLSQNCTDLTAGLTELAAMLFVEQRRILPVFVMPRDTRPVPDALAGSLAVREIDGADLQRVAAAIQSGCADAVCGLAGPCLLVLTPPYMGHARMAGRRASAGQDVPDPVSLTRRRLLASGMASEEGLASLERTIRDDIAAAARLLEMDCGG